MTSRKELEARNQRIATRRGLPSGVGFVLVTYDYGKADAKNRSLAYISSGRRDDTIRMLRELVGHLEGKCN